MCVCGGVVTGETAQQLGALAVSPEARGPEFDSQHPQWTFHDYL